jgi:hypothetical protein
VIWYGIEELLRAMGTVVSDEVGSGTEYWYGRRKSWPIREYGAVPAFACRRWVNPRRTSNCR